tara:strand:- start:245 stop:460 length:216 start_codon:yes stop_codon:yes gene_type:complete
MFEEKIIMMMRENISVINCSAETEELDDRQKFEMAKEWTIEDISTDVSRYIDREFWSFLEKKLRFNLDNAD